MSKKKPTKWFEVTYEVTLRGSILVEGKDEQDAREQWKACPEFEQSHCEMTDWECLKVKEQEP